VITNGALTQHVKLDVLGIRPMLSVILVSDELGIKKPDPRIFAMALDKLGLLASEVTFVGDNPELDIAGAQSARIRPIWLKCRDETPPENTECITAFDQLLAIL
jgi:putative hydrolase of the HAD superfamily